MSGGICAAGIVSCALMLSGCRTHERELLELASFAQEWRCRSVDDAGLREFAESLRSETPGVAQEEPFDPSDGLSLHEAVAAALWFNPDLRVARAQAGIPLAGAMESGRLDDPEVDFSVLRFVNSMADPWIFDLGIGFTIPLSGRLGAERDLAWAEYDAAWRRVAIAENDVAAALRVLWTELWAASHEREAISEYLNEVDALARTADALVQAGEIRPLDARVLAIDRSEQAAELERLDSEQRIRELELKAMMGIAPQSEVVIDISRPQVSDIVEDPDARDALLLAHPLVRAAEAEYEAAERSLRRQMLKTWPDITIGPAYENEEGQSRIGLGFGFPIPIFNANARAIAEAAAVRILRRAEAERTYQRLADVLARSVAQREGARARSAFLESQAVLTASQIREVIDLVELGEIEVLLVSDAVSRSLSLKREVIDALRTETLASIEIAHTLQPFPMTTPHEKGGE